MNYVTQSRSPSAGALAGALAIPLGVGVLLAAGLTFTVVINAPPDNPIGFDIKPDDIPPPPPPPTPTPKQETSSDTRTSTITAPDSPFDLDTDNTADAGPVVLVNDDVTLLGGPVDAGDDLLPLDGFSPVLPYDPVPASPKGNPGDWITNGDYRTTWISRELSGTARFTVQINTRGRVTDCTITGSTGHASLDNATCRLLTRRARFNPARDGYGDKVAGTYSSAVNWEIPE